MLEIILVIGLCKSLGKMLRAKGRNAVWMQVMLVVCWIIGEFMGGAVGGVVNIIQNGEGAPLGFGVYLFAIGGAALGAGLTFFIAYLLPDENSEPHLDPFDNAQIGRRIDPDNPYAS